MKFCFFCNISDTLKGKAIGGGELQVSLLAKSLALNGHEVVIVDPHADESFETPEGIKVINVPAWDKGIKGIRLFSHRFPSLYKILKQQNADYYYVRMRSYFHLMPYLAARKRKAKFIVGLAHDFDVLGFRHKFKYEYKGRFNLFTFLTLDLPNDIVFNYILKRSDYVTLQHPGQRHQQLPIHGKTAIFPNVIDYSRVPDVKNPSKDYYIAVGSLTMMKGAANLLQLLKITDKKVRFVIVGEPRGRRSKKLYKQLELMENVELKGRLNHSETMRMMGNARALINTSNYEGFPNIFLEAWTCGVPVISLKVNPGNVINDNDLGICCDGDMEKMKEIIEKDQVPNGDKLHLTSYIREHHDFATAGERFVNILGKAV